MRRTVALVACVLVCGTAASAQEGPAPVQVRNNVFAPSDVRVELGGTVRWVRAEGRHTVTADKTKTFDSGVMDSSGDSFTFTTPRKDVTIYYHCRIHGNGGTGDRFGSGMVGRIIVGAGSPPPPPPPGVALRKVPSKRWPSLERALDSLEPDAKYRIELAEGTYRAADLTRASLGFRSVPSRDFELTIRGNASRPRDVVLEGDGAGLAISVDGVAVENATVASDGFAGLFVSDAKRWAIDDVVVAGRPRYGVWIDGARDGRIRRTSVSGARTAGIAIGGCTDCDVLVDSVVVQRSRQGLVADGGGAIVVRGSTFRQNGVGVVLRSTPDAVHRGAHLELNTFLSNDVRTFVDGSPDDLPVGAGVWADGGSFDVVERNDFSGHSFGVVLTGPSTSSQVRDNTFGKSVVSDIAWDGIGANVCFSTNTRADRAAVTSMPPAAQDVYACDLPATVGVPYPPVRALVLAWGLGVVGR